MLVFREILGTYYMNGLLQDYHMHVHFKQQLTNSN